MPIYNILQWGCPPNLVNSFEKVFRTILKTIVEYHTVSLKTESGKEVINELRSIEERFGIKSRTLNLFYYITN